MSYDPEYAKQYREKNKDRLKQYQQEWYDKNKDGVIRKTAVCHRQVTWGSPVDLAVFPTCNPSEVADLGIDKPQ